MTLQQPLTNVRKVLIPAKVFPLRDKSEREKILLILSHMECGGFFNF